MSKLRNLIKETFRKKRGIETSEGTIGRTNKKLFNLRYYDSDFPSTITKDMAEAILRDDGISKKELYKLMKKDESVFRGSKKAAFKKAGKGKFVPAGKKAPVRYTKRGKTVQRAIDEHEEMPF